MDKINYQMYSNWNIKKSNNREWKHKPTGIIIKFTLTGRYAAYTKTNYIIYEVELIINDKLFTLFGDSLSGGTFKQKKEMKDKIVMGIKKFMVRTNNYGLPKFNIEKHKTWKRL